MCLPDKGQRNGQGPPLELLPGSSQPPPVRGQVWLQGQFSCIPISQPRPLMVVLLMKCLRLIQLGRKEIPHRAIGDFYSLGNLVPQRRGRLGQTP